MKRSVRIPSCWNGLRDGAAACGRGMNEQQPASEVSLACSPAAALPPCLLLPMGPYHRSRRSGAKETAENLTSASSNRFQQRTGGGVGTTSDMLSANAAWMAPLAVFHSLLSWYVFTRLDTLSAT